MLFYSSFSVAHAAGIKWSTESEFVQEGQTKCVTYGVYNPFGTDVKAQISLSGELEKLPYTISQNDVLLKAGTSSKQAVPIEVCFTVDEVYKEDCVLGSVMCEQKCNSEQIKFTGQLVITDAPTGNDVQGTGSKATVSAGAPLELLVGCVEQQRDYLVLYMVTIVIIIAVLVMMLFRRYRAPASERKTRKVEKLREKLKNEERKLNK